MLVTEKSYELLSLHFVKKSFLFFSENTLKSILWCAKNVVCIANHQTCVTLKMNKTVISVIHSFVLRLFFKAV